MLDAVEEGSLPAAVLPDRTALLALFEGDAVLLDELIGLFLDDSPRVLEQVRTAARAGNRAELRQAAHRLKGSVNNFQAVAAAAAALRLERLAADSAADEPALADALTELESALRRLRTALAGLCPESEQ
jgi:HPt (histidine-containing phosphotransfer) domain-containing protein